MKNQPLLSRLAETAMLIVFLPLALLVSAGYMVIACMLQIATAILKVWE